VFYNHGAAERAAAIAHHVFEDAEFFGREFDIFVETRDFAANAVESEIAHQQLFRGWLTAPQKHSGARQQFHEGKRFDQIIVRALLQSFDPVIHGIARAEDQDWRDNFAVADLFKDLQAIYVRQAKIENHQIVLGGVNHLNGIATGVHCVYGIAGTLQSARQKVGNAFFVFHYQ